MVLQCLYMPEDKIGRDVFSDDRLVASRSRLVKSKTIVFNARGAVADLVDALLKSRGTLKSVGLLSTSDALSVLIGIFFVLYRRGGERLRPYFQEILRCLSENDLVCLDRVVCSLVADVFDRPCECDPRALKLFSALSMCVENVGVLADLASSPEVLCSELAVKLCGYSEPYLASIVSEIRDVKRVLKRLCERLGVT